MQIRQRNKRTLYVLLLIFLFYWVLLRKRRYTESFQIVLDAVEPKVAWEFLADFSNQVKLNPTIEEFELEDDRGNYALWEYTVSYKEHFAVIPFFHNYNKAVFRVTPESKKRHYEPFRIDSQHSCCLLYFLCLNTDAEMTFQRGKSKEETVLQEVVHYECPPILSSVCQSELKTQKKMIYERIAATDFYPGP